MTAVVTGDKALDRALQQLPNNLQKKGARKATRAGAKIVLARARELAPHDSGELEDSLKVKSAKFPRRSGKVGHGINAGREFTGGDGIPYYSAFVEFGTDSRETSDGANRGEVEADPFLRPALYDSSRQVMDIVAEVMRGWVLTLRETK